MYYIWLELINYSKRCHSSCFSVLGLNYPNQRQLQEIFLLQTSGTFSVLEFSLCVLLQALFRSSELDSPAFLCGKYGWSLINVYQESGDEQPMELFLGHKIIRVAFCHFVLFVPWMFFLCCALSPRGFNFVAGACK